MLKVTKSFLYVFLVVLLMSVSQAFAAKKDLTVGLQLEPPHLDPTGAAAGAIDQVLYSNVFEGLTRFASDGSIIPGLAKSWTVSSDGLTYLFELNQGVTFHDGSFMDANDVKFSLDRINAEDSANAQKKLYEAISSVDVVDSHKVKITLSKPNGNLLFNLAWGDAVIVAKETIENIKQKPIGTGAFIFDSWTQGDRIELKKNDVYWGENAKLDKVIFKFISDPSAAFAAVMAEDVDVFRGFPSPENLVQFEADSRFKVLKGSTEGETILSTNNKMEPFNNLKVRKALAHAINRKEIIDGVMFGYGTPIGSHFAPHHPAYLDLTGNSNHDPDLSKKLLAEAGFPDGFETTLKLPPPAYARKGGEIIAAQLRKVGIQTVITNLEWSQWLEEVFRNKDYGLTIVAHTEPFDIGIYGRPDYYFQYDSKDFQGIMDSLTSETDPATRKKLLQQAQTMISNDYVNGFLFQRPNLSVINAKVSGIWANSPTQATDLTAVSWE